MRLKDIKIEKNIEIPFSHTGRQTLTGLLRQLEVGDSFIYDIERRNAMNSLAVRVAKVSNKKFTSRRISEDTVRIWRTA